MGFNDISSNQGFTNASSDNGSQPAWMNVEVVLTAEIGQAYIKVNQLMQVGRGAVIELGRKVEGPIALKVGDKLVARGDVQVHEENLSIRITEKYH
ncbi:MAG: FliM/FliN family flagellar motor switch protein [Alphaproteobacteria bacterium]|nr:FliM/FliN family flagellar motor switch protein [Alphaproteobacteria bacterium]